MDFFVEGENVIGVWLGDGWYCGWFGWCGGIRNIFGSDLLFFGQLEIIYIDGWWQMVVIDVMWWVMFLFILWLGIYDGEDYDVCWEIFDWLMGFFDDSGWFLVSVCVCDLCMLVVFMGFLVCIIEQVLLVVVFILFSGVCIFDFGQNFVGCICIWVFGLFGVMVLLCMVEVLQDGEFYMCLLCSV